MTYKEAFLKRFSNKRGNIKKDTSALEVWNSIEEFIRIVLAAEAQAKKKKKK